MTIASGTIQYHLGTAPLTGYGFSYTAAELVITLSATVADFMFYDSRKADIEALHAGLAENDFDNSEDNI